MHKTSMQHFYDFCQKADSLHVDRRPKGHRSTWTESKVCLHGLMVNTPLTTSDQWASFLAPPYKVQ